MTSSRTAARSHRRVLSGVVALGLVVAACGGDDDTDEAVADDIADVADSVADEADDVADDIADVADSVADAVEDVADDVADELSEIDLASVCPSPLVIQTDWFPEAEHGALYEMIGEDYSVDSEALAVSGPLVAGGADTGIELEVRTGGPAIGFNAPRVNGYSDDSIHIVYSNIDAQVQAWEDLPLIAVVAPLEINPQIIMWDPDVYPDIETIEDLGEAGVTINIFGFGGFADYFIGAGIWERDQVDPSYDGAPGRFIAEGDIAQQGFASAEPYNYEFVFDDYGKRPAFQLLHDAGYTAYSQTLSIRPDDMETLRPCLELFVPIVQQAVVDFAENPDRANAMIIDAVGQFDSFWVYDEGIAEYAVETMNELGLHGNGPDDIVGNLDEDRIAQVIEDTRTAGLVVPDDLTAADMFTNEFIDESIGF